MPPKGRDVIVIGTAAGGLEALDQLIGQLRADLPASIVIVQHMDPGNSGEPLLRRLGRHQAFHPKLAKDGERLKPTHIYIAPPPWTVLNDSAAERNPSFMLASCRSRQA